MQNQPTEAAFAQVAFDQTNTKVTNDSLIRPSRSGYTLLSLVLEDLVLSKLPQPGGSPRATPASRLASAMAIGTGFLFEKAFVPYLRELFPDYTLLEQPTVQWQGFQGTADFLLTNAEKQHAVVIDAKAFRSDTLREIKSRKLIDSWSYPTQLGIYHVGLQDSLPNVQVDAFWYIWSVSKAKLFAVEQEYEKSESLARAALVRLHTYTKVKDLLEAGKYAEAAALATAKQSECLLPKNWFYNNLCAATRFHYNPYHALFYPETDPESEDYGQPLEGETLTLLVEKLMRDTHTEGTDFSYYKNYLLDKGYTID